MTTLTRSEQLLAEKTVCILLVNGVSGEGVPVYAYVAVGADQLQAFMEAQRADDFILESHAVVIASGMGTPTKEVQEMMQTEYGFNHEQKIMLSASPEET
jgi:hypothetical protein